MSQRGTDKTQILTWTGPICVTVIVQSEHSVRHTKEHVLPLLPLPLALFLSSEWNKAQLLAGCLGGKSETDFFFFIVIVIPNNGESVS